MSDKSALYKSLDYVKDLPGYRRTDPQYFKDPMIDRLLEITLLLAGELWTVRDRLMIMEKLMATHGRVTPDMIETYPPDAAVKQQLDEERWNMVRRVFSGLYDQPMPSENKAGFEWVTRPPTDGAKTS